MMKKSISIALALILALTVSPAASLSSAAVASTTALSSAAVASTTALSSATSLVAKPTASTVLVDGKNVAFDAYNINDNNYFKLRDLAFVLSGTAKQFDVGWDDANDAISLTGGKSYTIAGGEMTGKGSGNKTPAPTASKIFLDGKETQFTAYNIDDNNYFKLRDIGQAINFGVDWDEAKNTIVIDTGKDYTPDAGASARQIFTLDACDVSISVPTGWGITREDGNYIPTLVSLSDFRLTPPPGEKALGIITIARTMDGKPLATLEFISFVTAAGEVLLPIAAEEIVKYQDMNIDGGIGVYYTLTDASLIGKTPKPDEYLYLCQIFMNLDDGSLIYTTLLTDDIDGAVFKTMFDTVSGIKTSYK